MELDYDKIEKETYETIEALQLLDIDVAAYVENKINEMENEYER